MKTREITRNTTGDTKQRQVDNTEQQEISNAERKTFIDIYVSRNSFRLEQTITKGASNAHTTDNWFQNLSRIRIIIGAK